MIRYHTFEQGRLVRDQTIQRLGGDPSPTRHHHKDRPGKAVVREFAASGPVNDLACFVAGADLRAAPAALLRWCRSQPCIYMMNVIPLTVQM